jgi:hypothetical protein
MTSKVQTANASKHNLAKFMTIAISRKKKFGFKKKTFDFAKSFIVLNEKKFNILEN